MSFGIGDRKDGVCLQLHSQVSRQPKHCRSAMFDTKVRAFFCVSGSLYGEQKSDYQKSEKLSYVPATNLRKIEK